MTVKMGIVMDNCVTKRCEERDEILISIMFITFNRKEELLRAIESCIQNRIDEMEVIIVDNHSTDGTQHDTEQLLKNNGIKYTYYYSETNLGVSAGRNKAFSMCKGRYVLCLDDDAVIITEDFFRKAICEMDSEREAVAASVEIYEPYNQRYLDGIRYFKNGREYGFSYIGAAHILRTSYFKNKLLYPPTFKFGSEEYYVAYRVWKDNMRMLHLGDLRVNHLPSTVARVYGKERAISIIVNNHAVRMMCYPKMCRPLLVFTLALRLIRKHTIKKEDLVSIKKRFSDSYSSEYANRMSLYQFCRMVYSIGIKNCI